MELALWAPTHGSLKNFVFLMAQSQNLLSSPLNTSMTRLKITEMGLFRVSASSYVVIVLE